MSPVFPVFFLTHFREFTFACRHGASGTNSFQLDRRLTFSPRRSALCSSAFGSSGHKHTWKQQPTHIVSTELETSSTQSSGEPCGLFPFLVVVHPSHPGSLGPIFKVGWRPRVYIWGDPLDDEDVEHGTCEPDPSASLTSLQFDSFRPQCSLLLRQRGFGP